MMKVSDVKDVDITFDVLSFLCFILSHIPLLRVKSDFSLQVLLSLLSFYPPLFALPSLFIALHLIMDASQYNGQFHRASEVSPGVLLLEFNRYATLSGALWPLYRPQTP